MSLPLSPTMVELFFELEKENARRVLREEMDSCMDTIFGQMKRKLMQLVESGGIETDDAQGDPTDREQQLFTNDINPSTSTNSHAQSHQVTRSLSTDDHFDDNNHQQNRQVNNSTDSDTQLDWDEHEIKEEFDDTYNQLELISNQTQNPNISLTRSNEQSNHNLTNSEDEEEENRMNHNNHNQQANPSEHLESPNIHSNQSSFPTSSFNPHSHKPHSIDYESGFNPEILTQTEINDKMTVKFVIGQARQTNGRFEDLVKQEFKDEYEDGDVDEVGDDLRDQVGHIAQNTQSHQVNFHANDDHSIHNMNTTLPNDPINSNDISNQQSEIISQVQLINPPNAQVNCDELSNELPSQVQYSLLLPASRVNGQSNPCSNNQNLNDANENGDVCECEDCLHGIDIDEEVEDADDDSDSVQWIEDIKGEQELPRPVKRPRLSPTPPNNATQPEVASQSPRPPTDESPPNQVNNQDKQYITVHLQCPLSECPDTFTEDQLTQHMFDVHSIGPFRCLLKDCGQTFNRKIVLDDHIVHFHQHRTIWHCGKCSHHFTSYQYLANHNEECHKLGHFQCSYPSCTFTGEYKMKMIIHFAQQHKRTIYCQHSGCHFQTSYPSKLKFHQRIHLAIKPYRCKWSQCDYGATQRIHIINHIHRIHLAPNLGSVPNGAKLDPKDYVEVVQ